MKNPDIMTLRAHHLLCSVLFQGNGYSEAFVKNMQAVVDQLFSPERMILPVDRPDQICETCPNALADGGCALDEENKKIADKDRMVLQRLDLTNGCAYPAGELQEALKQKVTESFFETCCGGCRWYRQGLCSYETFRERLTGYNNAE